MAEDKFMGNWETYELINWENFMKALGVGWIMRKAAARATSYINMSKDAEGNISYKWKLAVKSGHVTFKMEEEYDETTPDGRTVKSTMRMDGDELKCEQVGEPMTVYITRTIDDDGNMKEFGKAGDVECTRMYKKSEYVL